MSKNINGNYIEYKVLFSALAYPQHISKNLVKLLIKVNDQIYFPKFVYYGKYRGYYSNDVRIKIKRLDDIVYKVIDLTHDKCNERAF